MQIVGTIIMNLLLHFKLFINIYQIIIKSIYLGFIRHEVAVINDKLSKFDATSDKFH